MHRSSAARKRGGARWLEASWFHAPAAFMLSLCAWAGWLLHKRVQLDALAVPPTPAGRAAGSVRFSLPQGAPASGKKPPSPRSPGDSEQVPNCPALLFMPADSTPSAPATSTFPSNYRQHGTPAKPCTAHCMAQPHNCVGCPPLCSLASNLPAVVCCHRRC